MADPAEVPMDHLHIQTVNALSLRYLYLTIFPHMPTPNNPPHNVLYGSAHQKHLRLKIPQPPSLPPSFYAK